MLRKGWLQKGFVVGLMCMLAITFVYAAEDGGRPPRGDRGGRGPGGGFDREAMQERMLNMMQERMGASDEEWTVIQPRLSEVFKLSQSVTGRGRAMRGMFGRGRGGRDNQQNQEVSTDPIEKASNELQATLEKDAPTAAEIKAKLTALRGAREKGKQELAQSQKKLREVLSLKQEAQLVMMGILD